MTWGDICKNIIDKYENEKNVSSLQNKKGLTLTDEQAKQVLILLEHSIYADTSHEDREKLIDMNDKISWLIADHFDIDINNQSFDMDTLELIKY